MKLLVKRRWRWGHTQGMGDTHTGARWFLFGVLPVWRWRRRVQP